MAKIKHNDILDYKGISVIARDDCPPGVIYVINDKKIGDELLEQARLNKIYDLEKTIKKTGRWHGRITKITLWKKHWWEFWK